MEQPEISPQVKEWVRTAKEAGFAVLVVSNNHAPRLEPISRQLEINCIPQVRKPLPFRLKNWLNSWASSPSSVP